MRTTGHTSFIYMVAMPLMDQRLALTRRINDFACWHLPHPWHGNSTPIQTAALTQVIVPIYSTYTAVTPLAHLSMMQ